MEFGGATNPSPELETSDNTFPPLNILTAFAVEYHDAIFVGCAYIIVPVPPTKKYVPLKHDEYFSEIFARLTPVNTLLEKSVA